MAGQLTVSVLGLGLLGASLCMELHGKEQYRIAGWARNPETRKRALREGTVDLAPETPEEAVALADIAVLALPLPVITEFINSCHACLRPGAVMTDIGSVKQVIMQTASRFSNFVFVGSHPMAGTEKNGYANAFKGLYANADCFIVPPENADESAVAKVEEMWRSIGMKLTRIDPETHDALVANTSHAPHILASAMTLGVLDVPEDQLALRFAGCATGFRDSSRVASSSAAMWREIIERNPEHVLHALERVRMQLDLYEQMIRDRDFTAFEKQFARGKELRDTWLKHKNF